MGKKRKLNSVLIIFVVVLVLGLGYAYLTTTLSINGTTDVDSNTWNIYLDNVSVAPGSVNTAPVIDTNKLSATYNVHLSKPGDFLEFNVDVVNAGTIDGMIESITSTVNNQNIINLPNCLEYQVNYVDGVDIDSNHLLTAGNTDTLRVFIGYKTDINPSDLLDNSQSLVFNLNLSYIQADSSAITRNNNYKYLYGSPNLIGEEESTNYYYDVGADELMDSFCHPFVNKETIVNNIIWDKEIVFKFNNKKYYLKGGGNVRYNALYPNNVYESDEPLYYEDNKLVLQSAFGTDNCREGLVDEMYNYYGYTCTSLGLSATAYMDGVVQIGDEDWYCYIEIDGTSGCTHYVGKGHNCYSGS